MILKKDLIYQQINSHRIIDLESRTSFNRLPSLIQSPNRFVPPNKTLETLPKTLPTSHPITDTFFLPSFRQKEYQFSLQQCTHRASPARKFSKRNFLGQLAPSKRSSVHQWPAIVGEEDPLEVARGRWRGRKREREKATAAAYRSDA